MELTFKQRIRHLAAKKAWRTRSRRARPSVRMREWLTWLAVRPQNVIVQRYMGQLGSMLSFGTYPEITPRWSSPPRNFTRTTFFAMQARGWVEMFHRTEETVVGTSYFDGKETDNYGHTRYWRITDKGRKALSLGKPA